MLDFILKNRYHISSFKRRANFKRKNVHLFVMFAVYLSNRRFSVLQTASVCKKMKDIREMKIFRMLPIKSKQTRLRIHSGLWRFVLLVLHLQPFYGGE